MIKGTIRAGEDMKPGTKARGRGRHQDLPDRAARGRGTRRRSWPIRGRPGGHRDGDWCPFHGARLVGESAGLRRAGRGGRASEVRDRDRSPAGRGVQGRSLIAHSLSRVLRNDCHALYQSAHPETKPFPARPGSTDRTKRKRQVATLGKPGLRGVRSLARRSASSECRGADSNPGLLRLQSPRRVE